MIQSIYANKHQTSEKTARNDLIRLTCSDMHREDNFSRITKIGIQNGRKIQNGRRKKQFLLFAS